MHVEQDVPGAYELGSWFGAVIYIGSTGAVPHQLLEHLRELRGGCIREHAAQYL